jgi:hypothetical protein
MALKDWDKLSGLEWNYRGQHSGILKMYIDHYVPSKGWRVVIVGKYPWDNVENYFDSKKEAIQYAKSVMRR